MSHENLHRVSKEKPCPICNKPDWCLSSSDGSTAICQRIEKGSIKKVGDAGYLHIIDAEANRGEHDSQQSVAFVPKSMADKNFAVLQAEFIHQITDHQLDDLSQQLGVSVQSLKRLGAGWDTRAYTFGMMNSDGQITGIHRRFPNGDKGSIFGSKVGLFVPSDLRADGTLLVCEGLTDTASSLDLGFAAVGRQSCNGQSDLVLKFALGREGVVIVGDNDPAGQAGAEKLAASLISLCPQVNIIYPPSRFKDLRQWYNQGLTRETLLQVIESVKRGIHATSITNTKSSAELLSAELELKEKNDLFVADFSRHLDFPIDAMPKILQPFIEQGAEAIQCPADFLAIPLFTALGTVIGQTYVIEVKPGWTESTSLWTVVVGSPGTAKSPALNLTLKPLFRIQQKLVEEYELQKDIYEMDMKQHQKATKFWEKDKSDTGDPPKEPQKTILRHIVVSDATVEALVPIMKNNPKGLILVRDELAGWVNSMNQYKGGKGADVQFFLTIWSGGTVIVDRKSQQEHTSLTNTYLAVTGSCQPGVLIELLDKERQQDGFASRLLISYPDEMERKWVDSGIDESVMHPIDQLFIKLCKLEMRSDGEKESPNVIKFSPSGFKAFKDFMNIHFEQKNRYHLHGPLLAHWAKMEGYTARMALIIHIIRRHSGEIITDEVDEISVHMAVQLSDYFMAHAARLYGLIDKSSGTSVCERVLKWAKKHNKSEITNRDIIGARIVKNTEESLLSG